MAHSIEIRVRALELLKTGYTQEFVSKLLKVGTTSIKRWKSQKETTGCFGCVYDSSNRKAPKLPGDKLKEYFDSNPDALLKEAAEHFQCTPQAIFYACKRHKLTYKKKSRTIKNATSGSARISKRC